MSAALKWKLCPTPKERSRGGAPSARRSSRTAPLTTATAPHELSWSWKPVSWSSIQQISQALT